MGMIMDSIAEWLKEILVGGIISNLSGMFDSVNQQVGEIAGQVGATPQAWNGTIYGMIRSLSENVIIPIAGVILAFVMTLELIQMVADKNNMHGDVDTWMFFKWIFKTAAAVLIVTNTWNIVMGVFDVGQSVVNNAAGVIVQDASDRFSIRLYPNEGGITGIWDATLDRFYEEGNQVLRFAEQDNAIDYLADIQRLHGREPAEPIFTTPIGHAYRIGDGISSLETEHRETTAIVERVDEDNVWYTLPSIPEQKTVSIHLTATSSHQVNADSCQHRGT